ncbi:hypothetical protein TSAR_008028 [Trichomalopsis sarcophagae]|uniref:Uncharacterized protein n=1 Tax=Trichomalopsis sarcophagae TaxID=543379 RepID=A0A232EW15_9HYME|nr:hypothetical protein TSAR_008028 [Trichomalopsis sarcophagae]
MKTFAFSVLAALLMAGVVTAESEPANLETTTPITTTAASDTTTSADISTTVNSVEETTTAANIGGPMPTMPSIIRK